MPGVVTLKLLEWAKKLLKAVFFFVAVVIV